ncbi:hypothetical protein, partial [Rhodococcus sp. UFZ-B548]|uniref:hypothetical protein n=1 Tax=Rhodococcus sp. UFZ-B548 TaxID=2742212 RepID=UPI001C7110A3
RGDYAVPVLTHHTFGLDLEEMLIGREPTSSFASVNSVLVIEKSRPQTDLQARPGESIEHELPHKAAERDTRADN